VTSRRRRTATEDHGLLLRAGLSEPAEAVAAWARWGATREGPPADLPSRLLFPLVWSHLSGALRGDPYARLLADEYRDVWTQNQFLHARAAHALAALADAGVEVLVFKGASLSLRYYEDVGARPMADVDILVAPTALFAAGRALVRSGWRPSDRSWYSARLARHSERFCDAAGGEIDLHWSPLDIPISQAPLWESSRPLEDATEDVRILSPADELLVACVHGRLRNAPAGPRWMADAITVIRRGVDWDTVLARSAQLRMVAPVLVALRSLEAEFPSTVPTAVVRPKKAGLLRRSGRVAHWGASHPTSLLATFTLDVDRYARMRRLTFDCDTELGFARFLLLSHRGRSWSSLARVAASRRRAMRAGTHAIGPGSSVRAVGERDTSR
jgi:putative nucleotidyltransferase-like protein